MYDYDQSSANDNKSKERLKDIKKDIEGYFEYFYENNRRFNDFKRFICETALTTEDRNKLSTLNKSPIEFNETEAYISRQLGEFSKQQPSFKVNAGNVPDEMLTPEFTKTIEVTEGYMRYLISPENTDNISFHTFDEMMKGGYSVWRVYTEYENEMSFNQKICVEKEMYPTMCFFDVVTTKSHKGDGDFCGRAVAYKRADAERKFGKKVTDKMAFSQNFSRFTWSYKAYNQEIVLLAEYFKKKKKEVTIVELSNGMVVTKKEYNDFLELWNERGYIEQPPVVVDERKTEICIICRYLVSENDILEYEETDYKFLPLVFFDGSSVTLERPDGGDKYQMTRPYVYHLAGVQRLKNVAGQSMAYEIENTVAHKFMAAIESIDMTQLDQWRNVQIADVLLYQAFRNGNADEALPQPREVQRGQIPQVIPQTFVDTSRTMQSILGSYDAQLGIQGNNISGKAIQQGAMQSSAGVAPFLMGYINGLNQVAKIVLDLIPKYMKKKQTIPILKGDGKRDHHVINDGKNPESIQLNYDANLLEVNVSAGVNAEVQKQIALEQLIMMCKVSPTFAQFMNEEGMEIFLDNLDIRGIESLKQKTQEYMQKIKKMQAQAAQQPKIDPIQAQMQMKQAEIQQKSEATQMKTTIDAAKIELDNRELDLKTMELMTKAKNDAIGNQVKLQQAESEDVRSAALMAIEMSKHSHDIKRDTHDRVERVLVHNDKMQLEHKKVDKSEKSNKEVKGERRK